MKKENRWLLVWTGQTKGEKIISLVLLLIALVFLIIFLTRYGSNATFDTIILIIILIMALLFLQKRHLFGWLHYFSQNKRKN